MTDPTIEAAREIFDESVDHLREAIEGLSPDVLAWRPAGEDSNPITVLAVHGMHSSRWWLTIARGLPLPERDRPSEFVAESASDTALLSFVDAMAGGMPRPAGYHRSVRPCCRSVRSRRGNRCRQPGPSCTRSSTSANTSRRRS